MAFAETVTAVDWRDALIWKQASKNTLWCLLGCAIGDMGTVAFFQYTGGARLTLWVMPIMLLAGFVTPLPYNYWRLKALGKGCCH